MGLSGQEYWSGDHPDPGVKPTSLVSPSLQMDSSPSEPPGKQRKSKERGLREGRAEARPELLTHRGRRTGRFKSTIKQNFCKHFNPNV